MYASGTPERSPASRTVAVSKDVGALLGTVLALQLPRIDVGGQHAALLPRQAPRPAAQLRNAVREEAPLLVQRALGRPVNDVETDVATAAGDSMEN